MRNELLVYMLELLKFVWRAGTQAQGLTHVKHVFCL